MKGKTKFYLSALAVLACMQFALAQDSRPKNASHSLSIEGAGKLTVTYLPHRYNEPAYQAAKKSEATLTNLNRRWKKVGKLDTDLDLVIGGVQVPKGSYDMGFSFDANDNFKLILGSGGKDMTIPLKVALDGPVVNFLSLDIRPDNAADALMFEGRYGNIRTTAEVKVPQLTAK